MEHVYLHGLGDSPSVWRDIATKIPSEKSSILPLGDWFDKEHPHYRQLYEGLENYCHATSEPLVLSGHSLGAILALHYAAAHQDKVSGLILISAQYKTPKWLIKVQNFIFHFMPEQTFKGLGLTKNRAIEFMNSMVDVNLEEKLSAVSCPTLVLCGTKDVPNKRAARELAKRIKVAQLEWIEGGAHQVLTSHSGQIEEVISKFLEGQVRL